MISVHGEFSSFVVEGVRRDPIGWVVWDRVANPLDVVEELALASDVIVPGVYNTFDEVFWVAVNDERRGRLVAIFDGVRVLRFQLGYMEDGMYTNCTRKVEGEGHG